eukprot:scaffold342772_cov23-Prasinocladus_malaysianus.AAC.1
MAIIDNFLDAFRCRECSVSAHALLSAYKTAQTSAKWLSLNCLEFRVDIAKSHKKCTEGCIYIKDMHKGWWKNSMTFRYICYVGIMKLSSMCAGSNNGISAACVLWLCMAVPKSFCLDVCVPASLHKDELSNQTLVRFLVSKET